MCIRTLLASVMQGLGAWSPAHISLQVSKVHLILTISKKKPDKSSSWLA